MAERPLRLRDLRNIGPASERALQVVGITTPDELDVVGPAGAYRRLREAGVPGLTRTMLWALAGAVHDLDWRALPDELRRSLLAEVEAESPAERDDPEPDRAPRQSLDPAGDPAPDMAPDVDHVLDRVRGCLLGVALGDALGAPFEGRPRVVRREVVERLRSDVPLRWTDDTALTLPVAEHVAAHGREVDEDALALELAAAWAARPGRGYGPAADGILAAVRDGAPWREAAAAPFGGAGSMGNGGAMRVAPVGLLALGGAELSDVAEAARRTAAPTHAHPLGKDAAALQAVGVALAVTRARLSPAAVARRLRREVDATALRAPLRVVPELALEGAPVRGVVRRLGTGVLGDQSVPAAVTVWLAFRGRAVPGLVHAVTLGGDADTVASMAGALLGAQHGARVWPEELCARLEDRDVLEDLAVRLAARLSAAAPAGSTTTPARRDARRWASAPTR